jgi:hypothetical protein
LKILGAKEKQKSTTKKQGLMATKTKKQRQGTNTYKTTSRTPPLKGGRSRLNP